MLCFIQRNQERTEWKKKHLWDYHDMYALDLALCVRIVGIISQHTIFCFCVNAIYYIQATLDLRIYIYSVQTEHSKMINIIELNFWIGNMKYVVVQVWFVFVAEPIH